MTNQSITDEKVNICTCGRNWSHCRQCGSKNLYRKRFASNEASLEAGRRVDVFLCRKCGATTGTHQVCVAPPETEGVLIRQGPKERPQDIYAVDSDEYQQAAADRLAELTAKNVRGMVEAIKIMQLEGWKVEADESIKPPAPTPKPDQAPPVVEEKPIEPPMDLDQIIKQMTGPKEKL